MSDCEKPCGYPQMDCELGVYVTECEDRIEELEAKLAKAVEALGLIVVDNTWGLEHETYMKCRTTLAEIKGESHE